jgi:hypothetical protein
VRATLTNRRSPALRSEAQPTRPSRWLLQLLVELVIGLALAGLLVIVGWASSNAIPFVYGGY